MFISLPHSPQSWKDSDIAPLVEALGSSPILGFGEEIHTSDGFYIAKTRLFRHLIEHHGFRRVAFETPWGRAELANQFVQGANVTEREGINALFKVWRSTSMREFLCWLRYWNQANPCDRVELFGFDMQQPDFDFRLVETFIKSKHPDRLSFFLKLVTAVFGNAFTEPQFYRSAFCQSLQKGEQFVGKSEREFLQGFLAELDSHVQDLRVKRALLTFGAFTEYFHLWNEGVIKKDEAIWSKASGLRDYAMFQVLKEQVNSDDPKTLIWAHNQHLWFPPEAPMRYLGQFAKAEWQDKYKVVGITALKIEINWPWADWVTAPIFSENSLQRKLADFFPNSGFLLSRQWPEVLNGVKLEDCLAEPKEVFDALIFLPESPAIEYSDGALLEN